MIEVKIVKNLRARVADDLPTRPADLHTEVRIIQLTAEIAGIEQPDLREDSRAGQHRPATNHVDRDRIPKLAAVTLQPSDGHVYILPELNSGTDILNAGGIVLEIHHRSDDANVRPFFGQTNKLANRIWPHLDVIVDVE